MSKSKSKKSNKPTFGDWFYDKLGQIGRNLSGKGKKSTGEVAYSWYSLIGWALTVIFFSVTIFVPWLFNLFIVEQAVWIWILPAMALFMIAFGLIRQTYHWIALLGWVALSVLLIFSMYVPIVYNQTFAWLRLAFGL